MEEKQLQVYLSNQKILLDLCTQLTKDIGIDGFTIDLPFLTQHAFESIFNQIAPIIEQLEIQNKAKLNFILNRTDISEQQLLKAIRQYPHKRYSNLVSELIIKRELQKVVLRNRLS
jgi:hypothetical protein